MNFFHPFALCLYPFQSPLSLDPSAVDKICLYDLLMIILSFLRPLGGNRPERLPSYRPGYRPRKPGETAIV